MWWGGSNSSSSSCGGGSSNSSSRSSTRTIAAAVIAEIVLVARARGLLTLAAVSVATQKPKLHAPKSSPLPPPLKKCLVREENPKTFHSLKISDFNKKKFKSAASLNF